MSSRSILALAAVCALAGPHVARAACTLGKIGELPVTMAGLRPTITVKINGVEARMAIDSGAFFSVVTPQATAKLKLKAVAAPPGMDFVRGAGGIEHIGMTTARDFTFMGGTLHNADFVVGAPTIGDEVDGLIGENFLKLVDVEYDLANGVIRFFKPQGCGANVDLAYWAGAGGYSTAPIEPVENELGYAVVVRAEVNGHPIRALMDTGAPRSVLTRRAARQAGVTTDAPGVVAGGPSGGIGRRTFETWIAPFASFKLGGEEIKATHLRIGDSDLGDIDMLLGADFFASHRIYVSNSQHRVYFSYKGGQVFSLEPERGEPPPAPSAAAGAPAASIPGAPSETPTDAAAFSRRGAAAAARREYPAAIADFSHAIELEPANASAYLGRARARLGNRQPTLAMADLDQALKLKPDDAEALITRGEIKLAGKDRDGARADIDAAVRLDPMLNLAAGELYTRADDFERAVGSFDAWIAEHPRDPHLPAALNGRCLARGLWGRDLEAALADCNAALAKAPGLTTLLDSRGLVELRLGQLDRAIADYDAALKPHPNSATSLYGRGLAKLDKGDKAGGEADLAAAAAIDPTLPERAKKYGLAP